jgi:hypothetical protein
VPPSALSTVPQPGHPQPSAASLSAVTLSPVTLSPQQRRLLATRGAARGAKGAQAPNSEPRLLVATRVWAVALYSTPAILGKRLSQHPPACLSFSWHPTATLPTPSFPNLAPRPPPTPAPDPELEFPIPHAYGRSLTLPVPSSQLTRQFWSCSRPRSTRTWERTPRWARSSSSSSRLARVWPWSCVPVSRNPRNWSSA